MKTTMLAVSFAAVWLAPGAAALEGAPPRLRFSELTGTARVYPLNAPSYDIQAKDAAERPPLAPGDIVEIASGAAALESDLHATLRARAGCGFRFTAAQAGDGASGMRLSVIPGAPPLGLEVAGLKLTLWQGGRVALYDGGRLSVESAEVAVAPGSVLRQGERMSTSLWNPPGHGLAIDDTLALNVPRERGFGPGEMTVARAPAPPTTMETLAPLYHALEQAPPPAPSPPAAAARRAPSRRTRTPAPEATVASAAKPPVFDAKDATLRNAVGAQPSLPPAARELPAVPPQAAPVPLGEALEPGQAPPAEPERLSRNAKLGLAAGTLTALLAALEWWHRSRGGGV